MTALELVYIASVAGACLFFIAGAALGWGWHSPRASVAQGPHGNEGAAPSVELKRASGTLAESRTELARVSDQLAQARAELEQRRGDMLALEAASEDARARATTSETELAEHVLRARDLATENERLRAHLRDAEALRTDYVRLRTAAVDVTFLQGEIARLQQELQSARIDAFAGTQAAPVIRRARPRRERGTGTVSDSLAAVLEQFVDHGTRSTVIADSIGFPLASTGDDAQALAAYASLVMQAANRAGELLPVAQPIGIGLVFERGTRVDVWPFDVDTERLVLVSLATSAVESVRVETAIADLTSILAPAAIAS